MDLAKRIGDGRKSQALGHARRQYVRHQPCRLLDRRKDQFLDDPAGDLLYHRVARPQAQAGLCA